MFNNGPNTNGSQFILHFKPAREFDKKNVAFGKVVNNIEFLDLLE